METTERDLKVVKYNPQQFTEMIQKINYIEKPLGELASAPSAIVFIGEPCCSIKCCVPISCVCSCVCDCADYYRYNTLTNVNGTQKFLFKNVGKLKCSLCSTDKISRFENCRSLALSSYDQYSSKEDGTLVSEMVRDPTCSCFGLYNVDLNVNMPNENRLAGVIRFKGICSDLFKDCCKCSDGCSCSCFGCCKKSSGCCSNCGDDCLYDYFYCCDILNANKELAYTIYLRKCKLSCIPVDFCGYLRFSIKNVSFSEVGSVEASRNCCSLCGLLGTSFTYNIDFPSNCSPELKLTIINGIMAIDMFCL